MHICCSRILEFKGKILQAITISTLIKLTASSSTIFSVIYPQLTISRKLSQPVDTGNYSNNIEYFESNRNQTLADVYIALGSNVNDRYWAIQEGLSCIKTIGHLVTTSFLYESKPMYHTDQSTFLNAVCWIKTSLNPTELLRKCKEFESDIGRTYTFRNGPRVIDLDVVLYGPKEIVNIGIDGQTGHLTVPHPRMAERVFVLGPLCDINPHLIHPLSNRTMEELFFNLSVEDRKSMNRVIPCIYHDSEAKVQSKTKLLQLGNKPIIQGILNITPDSFSDGGQFNNIETAVHHALEMVKNGADIIDIGGESTRPGAVEVDIDEEISRVVPIIKGIREKDANCLISIDTRKSEVLRAAVLAGANIANDISGGKFDPNMISAIAELKIPFVIMHMRGTPQTMLHPEHSTYTNSDVVTEISLELKQQISKAEDADIPRWLQIIDPGIGFSKGYNENLKLLQPDNLLRFKSMLGNRALLIGLSRKRFLNHLIVKDNNNVNSNVSLDMRDLATSGACCAALLGGADILRVHNVKDVSIVCKSFHQILHDDDTNY
eukprot:gene8729-11795_t